MRLYETTPARNSEQQNIEPQNVEGWFRSAQSFIKNDKLPSFDIRYLSASGGFAFFSFYLRSNRPLFSPAAACAGMT
jgi:hypothetical protein